MGLLDCLPRPVAVELQGQWYLARQFRIVDLAHLESLVATAARPAPGEDADSLRAAYEHAVDGPPEFGSFPAMAILFGSPAGRWRYLGRVLRCHRPRLEPAELETLAEALTPTEWERIHEIALDSAPDAAFQRVLDHLGIKPTNPTAKAEPSNWEKLFSDLSAEPPHLRPWEVARLYMGQLRAICEGKKRDEPVLRAQQFATADEYHEAVKAVASFFKEKPAPGPTDTATQTDPDTLLQEP